jgi:hypothetical protein
MAAFRNHMNLSPCYYGWILDKSAIDLKYPKGIQVDHYSAFNCRGIRDITRGPTASQPQVTCKTSVLSFSIPHSPITISDLAWLHTYVEELCLVSFPSLAFAYRQMSSQSEILTFVKKGNMVTYNTCEWLACMDPEKFTTGTHHAAIFRSSSIHIFLLGPLSYTRRWGKCSRECSLPTI